MKILPIFLVAACAAPHAVKTSVAISGVKQALSGDLGSFTLAGASLQIACGSGEQQSATATGLGDTLVFSPIDACGNATLQLSVQAQTSQGSVTVFLGSASANLQPGQVKVNFDGSLAGEIAFQSEDGESFMCTGASAPISVPASGAVIPLIAGSYTLSCTGSSSGSFSTTIIVTPAGRSTITLPLGSSATPPTLASLTVSPVGFHVTNGLQFQPSQTGYTQILPNAANAVVVTAVPTSATATVTINGQPASGALTVQVTTPFVLTVTVQDGGAEQQYTVHLLQATAASDATLDILLLNGPSHQPPFLSYQAILRPLFSPQTFSYQVYAASGPTAISLTTSTSDAGATVTVNGSPFSGRGDIPVQVGHNTLDVHVVAADGFTYNDYVLDVPQVAATSNDGNDQLLFVTANYGAIDPIFDPTDPTIYTITMSSRHSLQAVLSAVPVNAAATMTLSGEEFNAQANVGTTPGNLVPYSIVVTAADAKTVSPPYTIEINSGLVSGIQSSTLGINAYDTSGFYAGQYLYSLSEAPQSYDLTVIASDPSVTLTVNGFALNSGGTINSGSANYPDLPPGLNLILIEASTPSGETDSYWIQAFVPDAAALEMAILVDSSTNTLELVPVSAGTPGNTAANQGVVDDDTTADGPHPSSIAASIDGSHVYYANDNGVGWVGITTAVIGSGPLTTPVFDAANHGNIALQSGHGCTSIAMDPKGRYLFALDQGAVETFVIDHADGHLAAISESGNFGATAIFLDTIGNYIFAVTAIGLEMHEVAPDGAVANAALATTIGTPGTHVVQAAVDASGTIVYFVDDQSPSVVWQNDYSQQPYGELGTSGESTGGVDEPLGGVVNGLAVGNNWQTDENFEWVMFATQGQINILQGGQDQFGPNDQNDIAPNFELASFTLADAAGYLYYVATDSTLTIPALLGCTSATAPDPGEAVATSLSSASFVVNDGILFTHY